MKAYGLNIHDVETTSVKVFRIKLKAPFKLPRALPISLELVLISLPPLLFLENISALYFSQAKMHSLSLPLIRIAVSLSTWISPAVFDIFCYTMLELPKVSSEFSLTLKGQTTICMSRDQPYCLTLKKMYKIDVFYSEVLEIWYFECQSLKGTTRVLKIFKLTLT